jgi:predicted tellurium resistance membrane protein TerC
VWTDLFTFEAFVAFLTLTSLEVVLGIDNVIFIAILAGRLPESQRDKARRLGLLLAVVSRILLVLAIGWVIQLKVPLFSILGHAFTGKDLILLGGGLFLIAKATYEIHHKIEGAETADSAPGPASTLTAVLVQVLLIDVVFSLDSVITAVGMTEGLANPIPIMVAAILASVVVMLAFSKTVVTFVDRNPSIKILALSFLLLIGVLLVAESFHHQIPKGYVYFAMAFSLAVDLLQLAAERRNGEKNLISGSAK